MNFKPYQIVEEFEKEMADYCGSRYAVSTDSCTNAIFLSLQYMIKRYKNGALNFGWPDDFDHVLMPSKTYLSVPMSVIRAGLMPEFHLGFNDWSGEYRLYPFPVWDSARRLKRGMYNRGQLQCLSFHIRKHLPIGKGGMILTDNLDAVEWLKRARYEGRGQKSYKDDDVNMTGWNHTMTPEQAARGLMLLEQLPDDNADLPEPGGYKDLREFSIFKDIKVIG